MLVLSTGICAYPTVCLRTIHAAQQEDVFFINSANVNMVIEHSNFNSNLLASMSSAYFQYSGGRAICILIGNSLTISWGVFENNKAAVCFGGAIDSPESVNMRVENSRFTNNSAKDGGGAISFKSSANTVLTEHCTISFCTFESNTPSAGLGGAVNADYNTRMTIEHTNFICNLATVSGGALIFERNVASTNLGGAVFFYQFNE
jgi:predicted outer membrane repeat protein